MSTTLIIVSGLGLLSSILLILVIRLHVRMRRLFRGTKIQGLEGLIADIAKEVDRLGDHAEKQEAIVAALGNKLHVEGHRIRMIRFNPFPDVGGNQSFALAIVNGDGDGIVISSLYSRERMSVFAKPVRAGKSDIELSEEEQTVVLRAQKNA